MLTNYYPDIPKSFVNPISPIRKDVPVHDFYSFVGGLLILVLLRYILALTLWTLKSFGQYQRLVKTLDSPDSEPREVLALSDFIRIKMQVVQPNLLQKIVRCTYVALFVGFLIPISIGLVIDLYLGSTLFMAMKSRAVIFLFVDWSTGAITTRLIYQLILFNPENRFALLINNAMRLGIMQANLGELSREIFVPVVGGCCVALLLPTLSRVLQSQAGSKIVDLDVQDVMLLPILVLAYSSYRLIHSSIKSLYQWVIRIREEEFIIGRRLENVVE